MQKAFFTVFICMQMILVTCPAFAGQQADCNINQGPCIRSAGKTVVLLDISPKPVRVMRELLFSIRLKGQDMPPALTIRLTMPGMYMGRNDISLKKQSDGIYSGKGLIPRCPTGKKLWQAEVYIPGQGKMPFTFYAVD